jgi:hypothetical protein
VVAALGAGVDDLLLLGLGAVGAHDEQGEPADACRGAGGHQRQVLVGHAGLRIILLRSSGIGRGRGDVVPDRVYRRRQRGGARGCRRLGRERRRQHGLDLPGDGREDRAGDTIRPFRLPRRRAGRCDRRKQREPENALSFHCIPLLLFLIFYALSSLELWVPGRADAGGSGARKWLLRNRGPLTDVSRARTLRPSVEGDPMAGPDTCRTVLELLSYNPRITHDRDKLIDS